MEVRTISNKVALFCDLCGNEFQRYKSNMSKRNNFCSRECYLKFMNNYEGKSYSLVDRINKHKKLSSVKMKLLGILSITAISSILTRIVNLNFLSDGLITITIGLFIVVILLSRKMNKLKVN